MVFSPRVNSNFPSEYLMSESAAKTLLESARMITSIVVSPISSDSPGICTAFSPLAAQLYLRSKSRIFGAIALLISNLTCAASV